MGRQSRVATVLIIAIGSMLSVAMPTASARQASPVADLPVVPPPAACTVEPRSLAAMEELLATPAAAPAPWEIPDGATPEPTEPEEPVLDGDFPVPVAIEIPSGQPADSATTTAVTATIAEYVACINAGDVLAQMALVSDHFLAFSFIGVPSAPDDLSAVVPPVKARPEEAWITLRAVRQVRLLADGRIGAYIDLHDPIEPGSPPVSIDFVFFSKDDGRWVIDQYVAGLEDAVEPVATPAP